MKSILKNVFQHYAIILVILLLSFLVYCGVNLVDQNDPKKIEEIEKNKFNDRQCQQGIYINEVEINSIYSNSCVDSVALHEINIQTIRK